MAAGRTASLIRQLLEQGPGLLGWWLVLLCMWWLWRLGFDLLGFDLLDIDRPTGCIAIA
jgi:hypothetical protein